MFLRKWPLPLGLAGIFGLSTRQTDAVVNIKRCKFVLSGDAGAVERSYVFVVVAGTGEHVQQLKFPGSWTFTVDRGRIEIV